MDDEKGIVRRYLGRVLNRVRVQRGLSLENVAEALGLPGSSRSYLSEVENGRAGFSVERIAEVARVLGCTPGDLVDDRCTLSEDRLGGRPEPIDMARLKVEVGEHLRRERERKGLTQAQLGLKIGCPHEKNANAYVSRIERGQHLPSALRLFRLARVLECHPAHILSGRPEETSTGSTGGV